MQLVLLEPGGFSEEPLPRHARGRGGGHVAGLPGGLSQTLTADASVPCGHDVGADTQGGLAFKDTPRISPTHSTQPCGDGAIGLGHARQRASGRGSF